MKVLARRGEPIQVFASTSDGLTALFKGTVLLAKAEKRSLDQATADEQLGRLGGSPFHLEQLQLDCDEPLFVPVSELNLARRTIVDDLIRQRRSVRRHRDLPDEPLDNLFSSMELRALPQRESVSDASDTKCQMHLLVRNAEQLQAALTLKPASVTLDYLDLYGLRPSVEAVQAAGISCRVASPRILKPEEQNIVRFLLSLECGILVRSAGLLYDLQLQSREAAVPLTADFSLNIANQHTFNLFDRLGMQRLTPAYDLNGLQITHLASQTNPSKIEAVVFQHLPVFHTEHCVFCRFLSTGTDSSNCGHPCEKHKVALRDQQGRAHAVLADVGCRNTVFSGECQTATKFLEQWQLAGIRHFRLEFVDQSEGEVNAIAEAFDAYLSGGLNEQQLAQRWTKSTNRNTTEGSLFVPQDFAKLYQIT
jgi:putative protease